MHWSWAQETFTLFTRAAVQDQDEKLASQIPTIDEILLSSSFDEMFQTLFTVIRHAFNHSQPPGSWAWIAKMTTTVPQWLMQKSQQYSYAVFHLKSRNLSTLSMLIIYWTFVNLRYAFVQKLLSEYPNTLYLLSFSLTLFRITWLGQYQKHWPALELKYNCESTAHQQQQIFWLDALLGSKTVP